ncbi:DNA polymerase III subunit alpha [Mycoplasma sp. Mirounga ES2805-ORL]|uniref:DNA polymerase III subunit alpha n=1 Tax=Mycoplasma sp. Mirounga ES2805-ORL TaxID=754514 RepID=UPI00197C0D60|nr:DNA polymerase III subunit alpha [Mycoplasma sp. Mirounga ES2805-ORL]QSF13970.1 DNA polymerase III subunit alpha [Mycoplasma sp. Mirounga ES2805-ORL]
MTKFTNLYNQTRYSFDESTLKMELLIENAVSRGLTSVVLADRNNLFAYAEFVKLCKKNNLKPIIGIDLDVQDHRFILLAKNYQGFQKLNTLVLKQSLNKDLEIDDIVDRNLIIIDHPTEGLFSKTKDNSLFNLDNYFVFSNKYVDSKSIFFFQLNKNEQLNYDEPIVDEKLLINNQRIIDQCNLFFPEKKLHLANFNNNNEDENREFFYKLLKKNLLVKKKEFPNSDQTWKDRLNYEIQIIDDLGFINYFLIIQDIVNWSRDNGIEIGPGRGSAAGSLVSYLLGITKINPLKYDLLFERFLNPKRVSWPDIDIDIQDNRRDEVFNYVQEKYGFDRVAKITTFQMIGARSAIKDAARNLGIKPSDADQVSKTINSYISDDLKISYEKNIAFKVEVDKYPYLFEEAMELEGAPRQIGLHAAGIIIADQPLVNLIPVSLSNDNKFLQVQLTMENIEDYGLLKIDLLGLRTLSEIQGIEKYLTNEQKFDYLVERNELELEDPATFALLNTGNTKGIFQIETKGMDKYIRKLKTSSFEELYALISLNRPGPKDYIKDYIEVKNNPNLYKPIESHYDKIVKPTNGIIVYQEQIMQIAQQVGDLSFVDADFLRKAISKKNEDNIEKYRKLFYIGAKNKNLNDSTIKKIYDNIKKFGNYGFNKSHAVAYAYLSMKMGYYKTHYPHYFYPSLISEAGGDQNKIKDFVDELRGLRVRVESPSILNPTSKCVVRNNSYFLPLSLIKGLGNESLIKIKNDLIENGPFSSDLFDTLFRLRFSGLKDNQISLLIRANVFRDYGHMKQVEAFDKQIITFYDLFKDDSYKDVKVKIEKLGYNKIKFDTDIDRDIDYEISNEIQLLGGMYNVSDTTKHEANFKYKMKTIPSDGQYWCVAKLITIKKFTGRSYKLYEFQDSFSTEAMFIDKNLFDRFEPLKIERIYKIKLELGRNGKPRLLDWDEV